MALAAISTAMPQHPWDRPAQDPCQVTGLCEGQCAPPLVLRAQMESLPVNANEVPAPWVNTSVELLSTCSPLSNY
ncbi:hypothetical protein HYALB_00011096 [Hymenoscyphus albidus]|uniref:Uncharacterized protein n=1 Tax=Hymenoscyphus albidus TaxID=595503 RepID=A0A9N9LPZ9_9HELO|nr:hypothetical protein HYALB_00011096 [Hymenoscyphus albidus]